MFFRSTCSATAAARDANRKLDKCAPVWQRCTAVAAMQAAHNATRASSTLPSNSQARVISISHTQLKAGVLDGSIASAAYDTACTSHAGVVGDPFIQTNERSNKVFALADGHPTAATNLAKLHHAIREPARTLNILPSLKAQSFLSVGKFSEAGYISICDHDKVNLYDGRTSKIVVSEEAVLAGWRCPVTNLWRISLSTHFTADNQKHTPSSLMAPPVATP